MPKCQATYKDGSPCLYNARYCTLEDHKLTCQRHRVGEAEPLVAHFTRCSSLTQSGTQCKNSARHACHEQPQCWIHAVHEDECAICMEPIKKRKAKTLKPCGHVFHRECMFEWSLRSNTCPMCRAPVQGSPYTATFNRATRFYLFQLALEIQTYVMSGADFRLRMWHTVHSEDVLSRIQESSLPTEALVNAVLRAEDAFDFGSRIGVHPSTHALHMATLIPLP